MLVLPVLGQSLHSYVGNFGSDAGSVSKLWTDFDASKHACFPLGKWPAMYRCPLFRYM